MSQDINFVQTLPLEPQPEYTVTTSQDTAYLEPHNKKGHKYVHVSSASLQSQAMFGKDLANKIVNAKGTYCKKCQNKSQR